MITHMVFLSIYVHKPFKEPYTGFYKESGYWASFTIDSPVSFLSGETACVQWEIENPPQYETQLSILRGDHKQTNLHITP